MNFKNYLTEENKKITIYFDMDMTLANFIKKFRENHPDVSEKDLVAQNIPDAKFWPMVQSIPNFWETLEPMKNGLDLMKWAHSEGHNVEILSSPSSHDLRSNEGKKKWVKKYLSNYSPKVNLVKAKDKHKFANENSILIDDLESNIKQFEQSGGKGLLFKDNASMLGQLRKMVDGLKKEIVKEEQVLVEKQLLIQNGAKYGQVVFLAGGGGSGKGFALENFMEKEKFIVRDVDELKKAFLKIAEIKDKHSEIQGLDLRNPKHVFKLHMFVKEKGIKEKTLELLLKNAKKGIMPNIVFDITSKEIGDISEVIPDLIKVGYLPKDIHIVWVLTKYSIAIQQNATRDRIVPDDIMLKTHAGAANTMWRLIDKGKLPKNVDGGFYVILNNRENTVFYTDRKGEVIKNTKGNPTIKDFKYLTVKRPQKSMNKDLKPELYKWVTDNVPKTDLTKHIWKD